MKQLNTNRSLPVYYDELVYTASALGADPITVSLKTFCGQMTAEFFEVEMAERAARLKVTEKTAVVRVRDQTLDRISRKFAGILLAEANHDRDSSLFRHFFSVAPSILRNQSLKKQVDHTQKVLLPELDKLEEGNPLKDYREPLQHAATEAKDALESLNSAKANRKAVSREIEDWKEKVNTFRLATYADLLKIATANNLPRSWADTFFHTRPRQSSSNVKAVEQKPQTETPKVDIEPADKYVAA
ncbi:MAG: hypothetical protein GY847_11575 [Proteobacteria bacterium]|nr:hypothetical protein [Pseudomonadota bacterium]